MRRDFLALKGLLSMVVVFVVAMLLAGAVVAQGAGQVVVPSPESVAEQLVRSLKAHRYEGATNQLSQGLRQQWDQERLAGLVQSLEDRGRGIDEAYGRGSRMQGDTATATVSVKLADGSEEDLSLPLRRENGLWKVGSLDPIAGLGSS